MILSRARALGGTPAYPPNPIEAWARPVAVSRTEIVAGAEPTDEGAPILFVQRTASTATSRTVQPGTLTQLRCGRPFHLNLVDLVVDIDDDGDLPPTKAPDPQYRMIFQEPMVGPFLPGT